MNVSKTQTFPKNKTIMSQMLETQRICTNFKLDGWHSINKLICRAGTPRKFQLSHIQTIFPKKSCVAAIEFNLKSRRKKVAALVGKNTAVVLLMEPSLKYAMGPQEDSTKMLSNISRGGSCFHPSIKLLTVATLSGNAKQPSEKASGVYIKAVFLGRVDPCEVS